MRRRKNLTEKERERLFRLSDKGKTRDYISRKLGIAARTVDRYLFARKNGFRDLTDFLNHYASVKGYKSHSTYQLSLELFKGSKQPIFYVTNRDKKQKEFEDKILSIDDVFLGGDKPVNDNSNCVYGIKEDVHEALDYLAKELPRNYRVIFDRFFRGMTLENLGSEMSVTKQRVKQIENDGIKILRDYLVSKGYSED